MIRKDAGLLEELFLGINIAVASCANRCSWCRNAYRHRRTSDFARRVGCQVSCHEIIYLLWIYSNVAVGAPELSASEAVIAMHNIEVFA